MHGERPVVAVVGPTATGKSDLALDLAHLLTAQGRAAGAEVVNADAMQLYRGMDIGTAKLSRRERRGIAHHQLDVLTVDQEASVAAYQTHARTDMAAIHARGHLPLLVGGSGLYVRAALDHLDFPGTDPEVRGALEQRARAEGTEVLHAELGGLDPQAAQRILPTNTRRVVRALEVINITGAPFSARLPEHTYAVPAHQLAIAVPRVELDTRIAARAARMVREGLVEETEALLPYGLATARTASRAVGYAQAMAVLEGRMSRADAIEAMTRATRQLARRQEKWSRRDPRVVWLAPGEGVHDRALAAVRRLSL